MLCTTGARRSGLPTPSKGGIRQKLRLSDCLIHVEISSLTFQLRGLKEDANKQIFSKMNKMLCGSLSAWDQRPCSWLLVGWGGHSDRGPQLCGKPCLGLASSAPSIWAWARQPGTHQSLSFWTSHIPASKQTKLLQSHSIHPVDLPS